MIFMLAVGGREAEDGERRPTQLDFDACSLRAAAAAAKRKEQPND